VQDLFAVLGASRRYSIHTTRYFYPLPRLATTYREWQSKSGIALLGAK